MPTMNDYLALKELLGVANKTVSQIRDQQQPCRDKLMKQLEKLDMELRPQIANQESILSRVNKLADLVLGPWIIQEPRHRWIDASRYVLNHEHAWYTRRAWLRCANIYNANGTLASRRVGDNIPTYWCWTLDIYSGKQLRIANHNRNDPEATREVMAAADEALRKDGWIFE